MASFQIIVVRFFNVEIKNSCSVGCALLESILVRCLFLGSCLAMMAIEKEESGRFQAGFSSSSFEAWSLSLFSLSARVCIASWI